MGDGLNWKCSSGRGFEHVNFKLRGFEWKCSNWKIG